MPTSCVLVCVCRARSQLGPDSQQARLMDNMLEWFRLRRHCLAALLEVRPLPLLLPAAAAGRQACACVCVVCVLRVCCACVVRAFSGRKAWRGLHGLVPESGHTSARTQSLIQFQVIG